MIRNLMTAATIAMLTATIAAAEVDMAFAKTSIPLEIEASSISVAYMMSDDIRENMQGIIDKSLSEKGIKEGRDTLIVIRPVALTEYSNLYVGKSASEPIPAADIDTEAIKRADGDVSAAAIAGVGVKGFVKGATAYGAGMDASSISGGVSDMASQGLFTLGFGLAVGGVASLIAGDEEYVMITDVTVDDERTRVFAFVNDGSIKPEEAAVKLSRLTAEKIAAMVKG